MTTVLYSYFRSSAAYRVRIALGLKGIAHEQRAVHLLRDGGQQRSEAFRKINSQGLVPVWEDGNGPLGQSLAIMEYLDEAYDGVPLLPGDPIMRARIRQFSLAVACDIHPVNNLRVLQYLTERLGVADSEKTTWIRHWVTDGLTALEALLMAEPTRGRFCFGEVPTMADCCLVPQLFTARRFGVSLDAYPLLSAVDANCQGLDAFRQAHPMQQPDAEQA